MKRVALLGCSKRKLDRAAPAHEMYQGRLFKRAYRLYAQLYGYETYILSALLGVVPPDRQIVPYDISMKDLSKEGVREWADDVVTSLSQVKGYPDITWHVVCGRDYWWPLKMRLEGQHVYPLKDKGGYALQCKYLSQQIELETRILFNKAAHALKALVQYGPYIANVQVDQWLSYPSIKEAVAVWKLCDKASGR